MELLLKKILVVTFISFSSFSLAGNNTFDHQQYVCPPCYHVKDIFTAKTYSHDGQCPVCGMDLIELNEPNDTSIDLHPGSGNFNIKTVKNTVISVFYHKPEKFDSSSKILLVIPGAGRNAWDYRDAWVEASEKYNVLVHSPAYDKQYYDYAGYHLGGILDKIEFTNYTVTKSEGRVNKYRLDDKDIIKGEVTQSNTWIFNDFDSIFDQVVQTVGSKQETYDIFGHSAGGQILHRMAIFHSDAKANRIVASNAGTYTLPDFQYDYPLGLAETNIEEAMFKHIFARNLILLVGEEDNDEETRGTMLHTPILDKQGLGRLARGEFFYHEAKSQAKKMDVPLAWRFYKVKGVGHEYRKISRAAANLLYDKKVHKGIIHVSD